MENIVHFFIFLREHKHHINPPTSELKFLRNAQILNEGSCRIKLQEMWHFVTTFCDDVNSQNAYENDNMGRKCYFKSVKIVSSTFFFN